MAVIIVTVVVQGALAPAEIRGSFDKSLLIINDGIFQAIGVISFGISPFASPPPSPVQSTHTRQPSSATTTPS